MGHEGSLPAFLAEFYERRIRRLIPPAIPVLIFTGLFAWYLLPPAALLEFGQSLIANGLFISNWFFLSIEGYFDGPSDLKPLLHTWSLSIEEQFYVLFPIPILLLKRHSIGAVRALLSSVFVLSLAFGCYLVLTGQTDAAFYNSLARFWEIALGGLLSVNVVREPRSATVRQIAGVAGAVMIAAAMVLYSEQMPFPGWTALLPTVGAALLILARDSHANRLLATKSFVAIGLISYALYLWHWPIFVLIQYAVIGAEPVHFALGAAAAILLATGSYFFIEQPVRRRVVLPLRRAAFAGFAVVSVAAVAFGCYGWSSSGAPERFPMGQKYSAQLLETAYQVADARLRSVCWLPGDVELQPAIDRCVKLDSAKPNVLLIGDSHAAQYYPAMADLLPEAHISLIATDSCTLTRGSRQTCNDLIDWIEDTARDQRSPFDRIVISARVDRLKSAEEMVALASAIAARGTPVTVLGPIQYYRPNLPTLYPTLVDRFSPAQMTEAFNRAVQSQQFDIDTFLAEAFKGSRVDYVSVLSLTCPAGPSSCDHIDSDGMPITVDNSHLTATAAKALISTIADAHLAVRAPGT